MYWLLFCDIFESSRSAFFDCLWWACELLRCYTTKPVSDDSVAKVFSLCEQYFEHHASFRFYHKIVFVLYLFFKSQQLWLAWSNGQLISTFPHIIDFSQQVSRWFHLHQQNMVGCFSHPPVWNYKNGNAAVSGIGTLGPIHHSRPPRPVVEG